MFWSVIEIFNGLDLAYLNFLWINICTVELQ